MVVASLSLTDLVDIVSRSGSPKATKVAEIKGRLGYQPAFDFYKPIREAIIETHEQNGPKAQLDTLLVSVTDKKKQANYAGLVVGYKKWWGKKQFNWFVPPRHNYICNGVEVGVNPELGLEFDGQRHIVKLYFKSDPLQKLRIDLVTALMETALRPFAKRQEAMCVLDVRGSKLFPLTPNTGKIMPIINAELAYVAALWPNL